MRIGRLPQGDPGVFRSLLLPNVAQALTDGEPVTAFGLVQDDIAVGALAGYLEKGQFHIASLYVAGDYRRCGGGRMLLEALLKVLEGYAAGVEISFTVAGQEQETLLSFLEVMGFEREQDYGQTLYVTTLGETSNLPFFASESKKAGVPFAQLGEGTFSLMKKAALMAKAPVPEGGLSAKTVDRDISVAHVNGGRPEAFVVFDNSWPDGLLLSAAWAGSKDPTVFPNLLRGAVARAREKYPPETKVMLQAVNDASAALIQSLLPEAEAVCHTYYRPLNLWM